MNDDVWYPGDLLIETTLFEPRDIHEFTIGNQLTVECGKFRTGIFADQKPVGEVISFENNMLKLKYYSNVTKYY